MPYISSEQIDQLWQEGLARGRLMSLTVASGSMEPLIAAGDRVQARAYAGDRRPRTGDVVLIRSEDGWVVHRLIGSRWRGGGTFYRQKGDSGLRSAVIPASAVLARVVRVEKQGQVIDLESRGRRARARLAGISFGLLDGAIRGGRRIRGGRVSGDDTAGRSYASRLLRRIESVVARLGAGRARR